MFFRWKNLFAKTCPDKIVSHHRSKHEVIKINYFYKQHLKSVFPTCEWSKKHLLLKYYMHFLWKVSFLSLKTGNTVAPVLFRIILVSMLCPDCLSQCCWINCFRFGRIQYDIVWINSFALSWSYDYKKTLTNFCSSPAGIWVNEYSISETGGTCFSAMCSQCLGNW